LVLCGHPKDLAEDKGFGFFEHVLSSKEWKWLLRANEMAYNFFFNYPKHKRKDLIFSFDLEMATLKEKKQVFHHKIVPYKLCKNGNLWLGLCHISPSVEKKSGRSNIIDSHTGERYDFINDRFIKADTLVLIEDEIMILQWMIKGLSDKVISERLNHMPISNFKRRKRIMYDKLSAGTSAEAIYKAKMLGVI
jgi:hypothetical protein